MKNEAEACSVHYSANYIYPQKACKYLSYYAIKEDKRYLQFKEQSLKLLNQETKELLDNYQNLLQELDDLKKFEKYIDLTQKRQELNEVRKRMSQNENIQKYYQSYYKINELLDEVTKIVFKDISDSLDTSGYKL